MAYWRDLSPTDGQIFESWRSAIRDAGQSGATAPPGVKDMGENGDVRFTSPDGKQHSVRDVPGLLKQLGDGVSTASRMNTVSPNSPPASTDGYPEGALWTQVAERDGKRVIVGVWQATAGAWTSIGEDASRLVAGSIDVGLLDAVLIGAKLIEAGAIVTPKGDGGVYARMDTEGFQLRRDSPDGSVETLARLGPEGDNFLTIGGSTVSTTQVATATVSAGTFLMGGRDLRDYLGESTRVIGRAVRTANTEWRRDLTRLAEVKCVFKPNRLYRVSYSQQSGEIGKEQAWAEMRTEIKIARSHDPGWVEEPSWTREAWANVHVEGNQSMWFTVPGCEVIVDTSQDSLHWALQEDTPVSIIALIDDISAANGAYFRAWNGRDAIAELRVEDLGRAVSSNGLVWQDPSQAGGGAGGPAQSTPQQYFEREYGATAAGSYWLRDGTFDTTYQNNAIQGSYNGSGSNSREGYFIFPDLTNELRGATIHWARFACHINWTYASAGADARVWTHNQLWLPGYRPGMIEQLGAIHVTRGGWLNCDIRGGLLPQLVTGGLRGFGLGAGADGHTDLYLRADTGRLHIGFSK